MSIEIRRQPNGLVLVQTGRDPFGQRYTMEHVLTAENAVKLGNRLIMEAARLAWIEESRQEAQAAPEPDGERFDLLELDDPQQESMELENMPFRMLEV